MAYKYTDQQRQINYGSATTGILADVRDIIEIDPLDNTKIKVKAPYTIKTVDATTPSNIKTKELNVPITSDIVHDIPPGFTFWIGVKDDGGTPLYNYHFTLEEFDLTEFAIIGRAFTDEVVALQLNGVVGTFWWEGWNYGKTLYDFATAKELSFTISGGEITPDAGFLTYTREEGIYWRFMSYNSLKNPNKGTDPQTAITAYFTYSSAGGFEQTSTFEVGFIDDGAGGKTAVPTNKWSIYKIFHFASSNFESAQRGKQTYDSLNDAKTRKGEEDLAVNSDNINAAFTHIAYVKAGATDLNDPEQIIFEKINPNSLSSGGDSTTGALVQSGVIDWVGTELLTINGGDNATFDVTEFRVGKVDRSTGVVKFIRTVSALNSVTVPNLSTTPFTYISYNIDASSLVLSSSQTTRIDLDNVIPLGRLWHRNNTNLDQAQSMQLGIETIHDYVGQLLAFGALKQSGLSSLANGANKKINLVNGIVEIVGGNTLGSREGINLAQPGGQSPLTFTPVRRQVTTEKAILEIDTSDIDFTVFDDGSGTLATIGNQKFGINYICIFPFRSLTDAFLIRGNKEYATHVKAKVGLAQDPIGVPSDFKGALCVIAIIAKKETLDLEAAILADDASITAADRFGSFGGGGGAGGGSVNLQSAYEAGGEPEIITNTTRGAVTLKRGSALDTDNVIEIKNGAGDTQFLVKGDGSIGINEVSPQSLLHITKSTTGLAPDANSNLVIEDNNGLNLFTLLGGPTTVQGVVFGNSSNPADGGILYDNTASARELLFRTNGNITRMTLDSAGNLGIGVTDPDARLEINGQIKITGGVPGIGKILTSDAVGLATWETPVPENASGSDGSIQFSTSGILNSDVTNFSWDNSLNVFKLSKTISGQVAELGNSIIRNRGVNDWAIKHKLFTAAIDDNVGFGHNTGGKITIGATLDNSIDFLTGDGVVAPTLKMSIAGDGAVRFLVVPTHADEAAAVTAGLTSGDMYKTSTGELRIKL